MDLVANAEDRGTDTSKPLNVQKRVALMQEWVELRDRNVLDAGCGAGGYVDFLYSLGANVEGIEFEKNKVNQWHAAHPGGQRVKQGDLSQIDYGDAVFDVVLLNEVLEHVPDDNLALNEIHRVMKPGGILFLFSPNRLHPFETHGFISKKTGRATQILKTFLLPYVPTHILTNWLQPWARNYWPSELRELVTRHDFEIVAHDFVWQTFENNSGYQPQFVKLLAPLLRGSFQIAEQIPGIRMLGVSQLIVARRKAASSP